MAYQLVVSPAAERSLRGLPARHRSLAGQLVNGLAELAAAYPLSAPIWARLGKLAGTTLSIELEGATLAVAIDPARRALTLVSLAKAPAPRSTGGVTRRTRLRPGPAPDGAR